MTSLDTKINVWKLGFGDTEEKRRSLHSKSSDVPRYDAPVSQMDPAVSQEEMKGLDEELKVSENVD